jgi:UDP-N-acetylglucosamine--N-acetylmuramyl-(pentapeptide) pyrophosphoryl-undecaprenol N-acetylglucosamine transferase
MKIAVIGGHITPAFAMMDALVALEPHVQFSFIGRMHTREGDRSVSAEYTLVTERKIPFYSITTGRLYRNLTWTGIRSMAKIPYGFFQAVSFLLRIKPDVVCSFGSYVAVPVVVAAWFLRIRIVTHEQTLIPGLANKIISRFCTTIALSFADTKRFYTHVPTVITGNPIRKEVFSPTGTFVIHKDVPVIYITGGNQGAHLLNTFIFENLNTLLGDYIVIHQTGNSELTNDRSRSLEIKNTLSAESRARYYPYAFVGADVIGDIYAYADVVVSRAGINTLCELWALGKKGIIFPITHLKHREQEYNAEFFEKSGFGKALKLENVSAAEFFKVLNTLVTTPLSHATRDDGRKLVLSDASTRLAQTVLTVARGA